LSNSDVMNHRNITTFYILNKYNEITQTKKN